MSNGRRSLRPASRRVGFPSIGKPSKLSALKVIPVSAGPQLLTIARMRSSKSSSPARIVKVVPVARCRTHSTRYPRRTITVRREQPYQALQRARVRATTEEFKTLYAQRAGIEGTISEASAGDGAAAFPVHRSRKDASATPGYRCRHEYRSFDVLAGWGTSCSDQAIGFGSATPPGCLKHGKLFASSINFREAVRR